jgi:sphinganine-1-phosphate aldolase
VSVLLHRDADLRRPQYFAYGDWPGYTMINSVIASTRSGGPIAAAFATLRFLGDDGYLRLAATTREAVEGLADAVRSVDGLRLLAEPESTVVCFTGDNVFTLADELAARGWHTQPQMAYGGLPENIHLTVTASVAMQVKDFGPALQESVAAAAAAGPVVLPPGLAETVGAMTPESLTAETVAGLAAALGLGGDGSTGPLPARMATVNTLLNAAPSAIRERLLVEFLGLLQRPVY